VDAVSKHYSYPPVYIGIITFVFLTKCRCAIECRDEGTDNKHIHKDILSKCILTVGTRPERRTGNLSPPLAHELAPNTVKAREKHRHPTLCKLCRVAMSPVMTQHLLILKRGLLSRHSPSTTRPGAHRSGRIQWIVSGHCKRLILSILTLHDQLPNNFEKSTVLHSILSWPAPSDLAQIRAKYHQFGADWQRFQIKYFQILGRYALPVKGMAYEWRCTFRENGKKMIFFAHGTWNLSANISETVHPRFFSSLQRWNPLVNTTLVPFRRYGRFVARSRGSKFIFHMSNFAFVQGQKSKLDPRFRWRNANESTWGKGVSCNRKVAVGDCCMAWNLCQFEGQGVPWSWWSPRCGHGI
jgi:hypothetical protein